jgi:hypothetical protein
MLIYADCFVGLTLDGTGMENADMVSESFFESYLSDLAISDQIVSEVTCPKLIEKLHREYGIVGYGEVRV